MGLLSRGRLVASWRMAGGQKPQSAPTTLPGLSDDPKGPSSSTPTPPTIVPGPSKWAEDLLGPPTPRTLPPYGYQKRAFLRAGDALICDLGLPPAWQVIERMYFTGKYSKKTYTRFPIGGNLKHKYVCIVRQTVHLHADDSGSGKGDQNGGNKRRRFEDNRVSLCTDMEVLHDRHNK